jgi:hypothetical protein
MFRIPNVPWANWNSYLEGGGLQGEDIVKSTLFCKVHYVLNSDIKKFAALHYSMTLDTTMNKVARMIWKVLYDPNPERLII